MTFEDWLEQRAAEDENPCGVKKQAPLMREAYIAGRHSLLADGARWQTRAEAEACDVLKHQVRTLKQAINNLLEIPVRVSTLTQESIDAIQQAKALL